MKRAPYRGAAGALRDGVALPLILFLLLALTLLAHGTLLLAQRDLLASKVFLQATQAREAARSALLRVTEFREGLLVTRGMETAAPLFEEEWGKGIYRAVKVRWLNRELFLAEGEGTMGGWPGTKRVGGVGWVMDPATRIAAFRAGVAVGEGVRSSGGGRLSGTSFFETPRGWEDEDCRVYQTVLDSLFAAISPPTVVTLSHEGVGVPRLGLLDEGELLARSVEAEQGPKGGAQASGAGCPGGGEPLFWGTEGSLTVPGGRICGLLVVGGDLEFQGEGLFQGVALVGGGLTLSGSWTFQGMARVRGPLLLQGSSDLETSGCAALRALAEIPPLQDPLLLPHASNITPF